MATGNRQHNFCRQTTFWWKQENWIHISQICIHNISPKFVFSQSKYTINYKVIKESPVHTYDYADGSNVLVRTNPSPNPYSVGDKSVG